MRFFILRHGETDWNTQGRFQGRQDTEVNERGLDQSLRAADYLAGHKFDSVVSSPLRRARTLAEMVAGRCVVREDRVEINPAFTEINHGAWEGCLSTEVQARWPQLFEAWHESPHTVTMPGEGGESLADVQLRAAAAADELAVRYYGDVCVTAHDAVIKALLCHFLDTPLSAFWRFQIGNCGLTIIEKMEEKSPRVRLMGDVHYLEETRKNFTLPEQKGL